MEQLSRSEKIAQARKNNKVYKRSKVYRSPVHSKSNKLQSESHEKSIETTSFQLRLAAASFLFLVFLGMKEYNLAFQNCNYETVLEVLTNNSGMETAEEIVISTFNSLD